MVWGLELIGFRAYRRTTLKFPNLESYPPPLTLHNTVSHLAFRPFGILAAKASCKTLQQKWKRVG